VQNALEVRPPNAPLTASPDKIRGIALSPRSCSAVVGRHSVQCAAETADARDDNLRMRDQASRARALCWRPIALLGWCAHEELAGTIQSGSTCLLACVCRDSCPREAHFSRGWGPTSGAAHTWKRTPRRAIYQYVLTTHSPRPFGGARVRHGACTEAGRQRRPCRTGGCPTTGGAKTVVP
jgi:hypothetical protein